MTKQPLPNDHQAFWSGRVIRSLGNIPGWPKKTTISEELEPDYEATGKRAIELLGHIENGKVLTAPVKVRPVQIVKTTRFPPAIEMAIRLRAAQDRTSFNNEVLMILTGQAPPLVGFTAADIDSASAA